MERDRFTFDDGVRQMAAVLEVLHEHPRPGGVTLRVVAGHGDRIRRAARAIAPEGIEVYVLEDDLVATVPALPEPDARPWTPVGPDGTRRADHGSEDAVEGTASLRCSYVFCRHRAVTSDFGLQAGDRCRQKIRITNGWLSCPGRYEVAPPARRSWWRRRR